MRRPTIKDVAERAEVSLKTVSRVINDEPGVQASTRARVQQAIAELDYQPDPSARSLRSAQAVRARAGLRQPEPLLRHRVQNGVLSACRETGYRPADPSLRLDLAARSPTELHRPGAALAPGRTGAGAADVRTHRAGRPNWSRTACTWCASSPPPTIRSDGSACVYVDDRDAAYEITEHLIQLGHSRIGFLWGGKSHGSRAGSATRATSRRCTTTASRLEREPGRPGDYSFDDGFRGARRLFALRDRPTAIFGSNDEIAAGVLAAAKSSGMNVPYDLSIAGFEDSPFSKQCWPALTTAKQATEEIARHAAHAADLRAQPNTVATHRHVAVNKGFSPQLVVRGSTARAPTN